MNPMFVQGIPDNRRAPLHVPETGERVVPIFPGTPDLRGRFDATRDWPVFYLPIDAASVEAPVAPALINHMADPDRYARALKRVEVLRARLNVPCFNAPLAVAKTTRDGISTMLQGIEGLVVPKVVRFRPKRPEDFAGTFAAQGFRFPVLTRMVGTQAGMTVVRVDGPDQWDQVHAMPWGGGEVYMIQAVIAPGADGLFRKLRLAFIGGQVLVRHHITSENWMVHRAARMADSMTQEIAAMRRFEDESLPRLEPILHEVDRRIGLDLVGMDCGLLADGRLLLFEANAAMSLLASSDPQMRPVVERIGAAIWGLLGNPARWRCQPSPA